MQASEATKAFVLGLITAELIGSEELSFVLANPTAGTVDLECDSLPFARFRLTIQEITA